MSTKRKNSPSQTLALARKLRAAGKFKEAKTQFEIIYQQDNNHLEALSSLTYLCLDISELELALKYASALEKLKPQDLNVGLMKSVVLMRLGAINDARNLLQNLQVIHPNRIELLHNLHSVESQAKDFQAAATVAMRAVEMDPTDANAYNNLGSSMNGLGLHAQAKAAFEVVLALKPDHGTATANLALILAGEGKLQESIVLLETVLKAAEAKHDEGNIQALRHNLAFQYLKVGRLQEGWSSLESGFSSMIDKNRGRRPQRGFDVPRWKGQPLKGKTLMVWREQGLGDEILFSTNLKELAGIDGKVIVECEPRLVETWKRSFPDFEFRVEAYYNDAKLSAFHKDFDYQIPIGSLCGIYRNTIADFERSKPFVIPDPVKVSKYKERLLAASDVGPNTKFVGICWRSGIIAPTRNSGYTVLQDWKPIFDLPDVRLVNLQYGQCEDEIVAVEEQFGISILRWPDLNLQSDLDDVFALMASLDHVVTVATAVNAMSGAIGADVRLIAQGNGWPFLGTDRYPFYPTATVYLPDQDQPVATVLYRVASDLGQA